MKIHRQKSTTSSTNYNENIIEERAYASDLRFDLNHDARKTIEASTKMDRAQFDHLDSSMQMQESQQNFKPVKKSREIQRSREVSSEKPNREL